jgi:hypothetical protein
LGVARTRRGALHVGVLLAVLLQLGFASAFFADAANTNRIYSALSAHRVSVNAQTVGCFAIASTRTTGGSYAQVCRVTYEYDEMTFSAVIPYRETRTFYIDPLDTSMHMNKAIYESSSTAKTGDIVIGSLLLLGAGLVTTLHQLHMHRSRRRRARSESETHHRREARRSR